MNPYHHALSSAAKYGGNAEDYLELHQWLDESKAYFPDFRHRALRHHAEGIFLLERLFGVTVTNSAGREVPVRFIGEQHVIEDLGRIPTAQDWLECVSSEPWMMTRGKLLYADKNVPSDESESNSSPEPAIPNTPTFNVYHAEIDGVTVVHVDTQGMPENSHGPIIRVYLNDEPIFENPPYRAPDERSSDGSS